jgi:hypothetical protein
MAHQAMGRLEDMGPPTDVDGGSTTVTKGYHVAGLNLECAPSGTWAEHPQ